MKIKPCVLVPLKLSHDEMEIQGLVKDIAEIKFHNEAAALFEDYNERQRLAQYFGIDDIDDYDEEMYDELVENVTYDATKDAASYT